MLIGYARVSTAGESFDLQKEALDRAGVDRLLTDVASGANAKRPRLEQALSQLREGDTLVVWKLDRLSRNLGHLIETVENLGRRGIGFRSLQDNIDTTTSASEPVFHVFTALAQFHRDLIRERNGAGRAKARARGRRGGRKPKLDERGRVQAVMLHKDLTKSVADICQTLQIGRRTLYRYVSKESKRKVGRKPKAKTSKGSLTSRRE